MTDIASFLLDLAKGNFSSDEIKAHLERLDRLKRFSSSKAESDAIDLPDDWQHWPSTLRGLERDGRVRLVDGRWEWQPEKVKASAQKGLFD